MPVQETGVQSVPDVESLPVSVIVAASLLADSVEQPQRTRVREDCEHCPGQNGKKDSLLG